MFALILRAIMRKICWWIVRRDVKLFDKLVNRINLRFQRGMEAHERIQEKGNCTKYDMNEVLMLLLARKYIADLHRQFEEMPEMKELERLYPDTDSFVSGLNTTGEEDES